MLGSLVRERAPMLADHFDAGVIDMAESTVGLSSVYRFSNVASQLHILDVLTVQREIELTLFEHAMSHG